MRYRYLSSGIYKSLRLYFTLPALPRKKEYFARKLIGYHHRTINKYSLLYPLPCRYSCEEMYSVVVDVKNYKKFVPFCTDSTILEEKSDQLRANLQIGFPPIIENYTSNVSMLKPSLVQAVCKDGRLFNYLETTWKFSPGLKSNPQSCVVDFYILFEFKSVIYSQVANMFFDKLVDEMENAFFDEAKRRYGQESIPTHELSSKIQR